MKVLYDSEKMEPKPSRTHRIILEVHASGVWEEGRWGGLFDEIEEVLDNNYCSNIAMRVEEI